MVFKYLSNLYQFKDTKKKVHQIKKQLHVISVEDPGIMKISVKKRLRNKEFDFYLFIINFINFIN